MSMTDATQLHLSYIGSHLIKTDSTQYMLLLYPVDPFQTANPDIYHRSGGHSFDLHWGSMDMFMVYAGRFPGAYRKLELQTQCERNRIDLQEIVALEDQLKDCDPITFLTK